MSQLILKSANAISDYSLLPDYNYYLKRVAADGGTIRDMSAVQAAFSYAFANGITDDMAFCVVSPNFGYKVAGAVIKLYSLFNPAGDISLTVNASSTTYIDTTTYTFPVINYKNGRTTNAPHTLGTISGVKSAGMCIAIKTPVLADAAAYGSPVNFPLGLFGDISSADVRLKRMLEMRFTRLATEMPNLWDLVARGYGTSGILTATDITANGWLHTTSYVDTTGLYLYKEGAQAYVDNAVTMSYENNMSFSLGKALNDVYSTYTNVYDNFWAHFAEVWVLANTSSVTMQNLSSYLTTKYPNA